MISNIIHLRVNSNQVKVLLNCYFDGMIIYTQGSVHMFQSFCAVVKIIILILQLIYLHNQCGLVCTAVDEQGIPQCFAKNIHTRILMTLKIVVHCSAVEGVMAFPQCIASSEIYLAGCHKCVSARSERVNKQTNMGRQ